MAEQLEQLIMNGTILPGSFLPTNRELATQLNVDRSTIISAYNHLTSIGLIESIPRKGTIVKETMWGLSLKDLFTWSKIKSRNFTPSDPLLLRYKENLSNPHVLNLSDGIVTPEDLMPEGVYKEILQSITNTFRYDKEYGEEFKDVLLEHLDKHCGIRVRKNQVIPSAGIHKSINLVVSSLLNEGDTVAIECPSWLYSTNIFSSKGIRTVKLDIEEEGIDPEQIYQLYKRHRIKMIFVNPTFQSPSTSVLSVQKKKRILEICKELEIGIVEYEAFRNLSFSSRKKLSPTLFSLDEENQSVIHIADHGDLSFYTLCEIGWILAPQMIIDIINDSTFQQRLQPQNINLAMATEYLGTGLWKARNQDLKIKLHARSKIVLNTLKKYNQNSTFSYAIPQGGHELWCKINKPINDKQLFEKCLQHGVLISPSGIYGKPNEGYVKLSFALCPADILEEGIRRFCETVIEA
nr:PLP-dependent aminotransferase family protein [Anaerobacillus alkaliphilus]